MGWVRGHILGRGSSATVSTATSTSTSGETFAFAVKSVDLTKSETLQREHQFLSILNSPYVVSYKGCDISTENNKRMYNLLIEYMPHGTLIDAVNGQPDIVSYTRQIVQGLEYIHSCGIVHCDIKGCNILIGGSGAKIADLGCARWADEAAPFRGTPMFMAPEVARGEEQGFPADIWALGCTVIQMGNRGSPWPNVRDPVSVLYKIAFSGELPQIPDVFSHQARDFVGKCLIRDPRERWTAKQLLKHPFLEGHTKQIDSQDFNRDSPTSILDQDVWDSVGVHVQQSNSQRQRIKQLADKSEMPKWRRVGEINWITIRSNEDDGEAKTSGGVASEMEIDN